MAATRQEAEQYSLVARQLSHLLILRFENGQKEVNGKIIERRMDATRLPIEQTSSTTRQAQLATLEPILTRDFSSASCSTLLDVCEDEAVLAHSFGVYTRESEASAERTPRSCSFNSAVRVATVQIFPICKGVKTCCYEMWNFAGLSNVP